MRLDIKLQFQFYNIVGNVTTKSWLNRNHWLKTFTVIEQYSSYVSIPKNERQATLEESCHGALIVIDTWLYLHLSRDRTQFKKDSPRKSLKFPNSFAYVLLQAHESATSILEITDQSRCLVFRNS